jgi:hypothetical protein
MTHDNTRMLAIHAEEQASAAVVGVGRVGRAFHRANWVWGVLAFLVVVAGSGYVIRDRMEHFATKEKVDALDEDNQRTKEEMREINAVLRGVVDTQKRTIDGVDEVKRILMNGRRR